MKALRRSLLRPLSAATRRVRSSSTSHPSSSELTDSKLVDTTLAPIIFEKFKLQSFSDEELRKAFKAIDTNNTERLEISDVKSLFENCAVRDGRHVDQMTNAVMQSLASADGSSTAAAAPRSISFDEFQRSVKRLASQRDGRIWPIATTMCVAGTSVGMVIPVMPLLVLELGLTQAQYGYVVGCFGLSKLLANVPSSVLVSNPSIGRRGALTSGLLVVGGANVLISLASGFEELALARLLAGGGVSLLLAGATMAVADISTPLNRSSMMAPMNIAFSSGTVMGPAIGGMLSGTIGIAPTFLACGGAFAINAVGTRLLTAETMRPPPPAATATACDEGSGATGRADLHRADGNFALASSDAAGEASNTMSGDPSKKATADPAAAGEASNTRAAEPAASGVGSFGAAVATTLRGWGPLWRHDELRGLLILNGCHWFCLAGSNMTLLPLMLASDRFGLAPAEVGGLFAMQSAISVVGAMPSARLADRVGPANVLAPALLLSAMSMAAFPLATELPHAAGVLCTWAMGGVLLGSAPSANVANLAPPEKRAQALALMRTSGDLGLLTGAVSVGSAATLLGNDLAMQGTAGVLVTAATWFALRRNRAQSTTRL